MKFHELSPDTQYFLTLAGWQGSEPAAEGEPIYPAYSHDDILGLAAGKVALDAQFPSVGDEDARIKQVAS